MSIEKSRSVFSESVKLTILVLIGLVLTVYLGGCALFKQFPDQKNPKTMTYNWTYQDRPYSLSLTVYQSVYDYYNKKPKGVLVDEEESSLRKYLDLPVADSSIKELTTKLNALAESNGMDEDQKLELAVSFVQGIPYDVEKAKTDLTHPRYAYEVLYENKGICSDKSFLMYAILREMGFGGTIFLYPQEEHMNVGVEVDLQYSTDNSGYTMIETTNPRIKIGVIPSIDASSRQALEKQTIQEFNLRNPNTTDGKNLSSPQIYAKTTGKKYYGIIRTFQTIREIADIQDYLTEQKPVITEIIDELTSLEQRMNSLRERNSVHDYNNLVSPHNKLVAELNSLVNEYNAEVNQYNSLVAEFY